MAKKAAAWVVDYDAARAQAIRWLGDRYLLAKPINRSQRGWRPAPPPQLKDSSATSHAAAPSPL